MATLIVNVSPVTASPPSRAQRIRTFLQRHNLRAWIAWRPDELVMLSGYFLFWGASKRGAGARIEDSVLVTESGHEVLSRIEGHAEGADDWGRGL
jgi:hypothetical protein